MIESSIKRDRSVFCSCDTVILGDRAVIDRVNGDGHGGRVRNQTIRIEHRIGEGVHTEKVGIG